VINIPRLSRHENVNKVGNSGRHSLENTLFRRLDEKINTMSLSIYILSTSSISFSKTHVHIY
jgi:hypothetical protein